MSQFGTQIDDVHNRYRARFAGFPRITRDPSEMEEIVASAKKLAKSKLDKDEKERLSQNVELYERELEGIKEAQGQGAEAFQTHRMSTWANFVQARYSRYFAGQERRSRDLGILGEMIEHGDLLLGRMRALQSKSPTDELAKAIETTESNYKIYRMERDRIREDRKKVFGAQRATVYANLANGQFGRYRLHFANKSRMSRNPRLLEQISEALQEILDGMEALYQDGFNTETHKKNIDLVKNNLGVYKAELTNIKTARRESKLDDRIGFLGAAANDIFGVYRENFAGKDRKTRDIDLLGNQIELLYQIGWQMEDIDRTEDHDVNAKNLRLVNDMLYLYHREHTAVKQLQTAKS